MMKVPGLIIDKVNFYPIIKMEPFKVNQL